MKKILYVIVSFLTFGFTQNVFGALGNNTIKDGILSKTVSDVGVVSGNSTSSILGGLFTWFKSEIFSLIMVLSIAVFIFIGIKFATAKGNPEEFKKAWLHLVYAIIGIFFIFMAWGLVTIIASLSL